jgi:hypothetical protein
MGWVSPRAPSLFCRERRGPDNNNRSDHPMTDFAARRGILIIAALMCAWHGQCLQARAAKTEAQKPQISIAQSYVAISVTVDLDLRPFSGIFNNCFAEGKAWADQKTSDTAAEWRDNRKAFRDGLKWFYDREYTLRSVVGRYISVVRGDEWFDGGAHPNQHLDTILWDNAARKRTNIRGFFTETADNGPAMTTLAQLAKIAVASAKLAKGIGGYDDDNDAAQMTPELELQQDTFINEGITPSILGIGPVTLAPSTESGKSSGLTFHYSPYGVGPYVEGPYTVFVPWAKFREYLSPEGAAIFGGERPKNDEEQW